MTKPEVSVVPTQADREAAADLRAYTLSLSLTDDRIKAIREGMRDDTGMVQALARHRLAHQTPPVTQPIATVITAQMLHHALNTADDERHGADQAYMCHDAEKTELDDFLVDGRLNLVRAAEVLSVTLHTPPPVATATVEQFRVGAIESAKADGADADDLSHFRAAFSYYDAAVLRATPTPPAGGQ